VKIRIMDEEIFGEGWKKHIQKQDLAQTEDSI
jgi:hypothetical protein